MVVGDRLNIPVYAYNNLDAQLAVPFTVTNISDSLLSVMTFELNYVSPNSNLVKDISFTARSIDDEAYVTI